MVSSTFSLPITTTFPSSNGFRLRSRGRWWNPKVSIRPPPPGFDYKSEVLEDSRLAVAATNPKLMDLVESGALVVIEKGRFGPVPGWRREFVEPEAIWLIGTSHISEESAVNVERVPVMAGGQSALALRLLLAVFSSKISSGANRTFGDEFRAARKISEEVGAQIVLGDRPIEITLERAWSSLTWNEKLRLVISLFQGITFPSSELPENNLKDQEMDGSPFKLYEQLSISYPSLLQPLMNERDTIVSHFQYLAWSLKRSKAVNRSKTVVGVIGKGHMNGVVYALMSDQGNLRFRDLVGRTSVSGSNGWLSSILTSLVRDTILGFILWAVYEQLKAIL
ncbi:traB domain-containing protein [Cocos nucifera]|uniref:TraB domain-containing protein n=1 Tax=Cocos nucifera TaxID=13894 RepID=A0A8K0III4_COCNU|nr:traB domain-containing protein [Cocos nucifera]